MSKIAFLYPGQGVQTSGMGADFYRNSASARAVFDEVKIFMKKAHWQKKYLIRAVRF